MKCEEQEGDEINLKGDFMFLPPFMSKLYTITVPWKLAMALKDKGNPILLGVDPVPPSNTLDAFTTQCLLYPSVSLRAD